MEKLKNYMQMTYDLVEHLESHRTILCFVLFYLQNNFGEKQIVKIMNPHTHAINLWFCLWVGL